MTGKAIRLAEEISVKSSLLAERFLWSEGNELGEIGILLTQRKKYTDRKTNSGKEKIDPAFDGLIKVYLDFIKNKRTEFITVCNG